MASANISNVNFGIEQFPNSGVNTQPSQTNPGGTTSIAVPATSFSGTDPDGGTPASLRITVFPASATTITINGTTYTSATFPVGGVTVPTNASGQPTQAISVDPIDGNVSVVISYAAIDNGGNEDTSPGSVTLPFFNVNLSGNVFNDLNGLTDNIVNGTGIGSPSTTQLYVNLLDATGTTVIATVPVGAGGTYSFSGIPGNTNYIIQVSTNQGTVSQPAPATALPTNWVNTGENIGAGTGSDGTVNGLLPISVLGADIINVNFSIEQLPGSGTNTQSLQSNPPGTANVTVPASAFSGSDPDAGIISSLRITSFPTNAASITINGTTYTSAAFPAGGVVVPTNASGQPAQTITVDPVDGLISIVISYAAIDNAGKEDPTPGSVTLPFSNLNISGNVFNDANGLNGTGNVDGSGMGTAGGSQLYANLLDATETTVIATVPVNTDGTYNFYGVTPNTNYVVQLSVNQGTVGSPAPVKALPAGWVNTGEDCCDNTGSDGTVNGLTAVSVVSSNVINVNFGINRPPTGTDITAAQQLNPGGVIQVQVPALSGSDPEDGTLGAGAAIRIDVLPTNATIYYNGIAVAAGVTIPNYNPALLTIDPDPNTAAQPHLLTNFQYSFADAAGVFDPVSRTITMEFLQPVAITGNIYNDVNGSANNTHLNIQDGAETGTNAANLLYAYVVDINTGLIIRKDTVNADGTYSFDGLTVIGNVRIMITTDNTIVGAAPPSLILPAGWANTSPLDTTFTYNNPPGLLITNVNFGIEELPETFSSTQPTIGNPGGTLSAAIAPSAFYGEDVAIGTVTSIRIISFPTNATSITINGTTYTSGTFLVGGVVIPTNGNGQPTVPVSIDPINGTVTVSISYAARDNAGREDPTPATVILEFSSVLPLRNIVLKGNLNGGIITINWNTIGELDVNKFELQRSLDGINFIAITNQASKGDGDKAYHAADNQLGINGKVAYYRIKTIDKNGNYSYSGVIKINLDELKEVVIRPNPFIAAVNLQFNVQEKTNGTVNIYNIDGKKVYGRYFELAQGLNSIEVNGLEKLPAGVYIIELIVEGEVRTEKIIKAEK
jgi:hypothetical protein